MDTISIRYGETVTLPLDAGNPAYVTADIFIGNAGQAYLLTKSISLTDGKGVFVLSEEETKIPLGEYNYQINVTDISGNLSKFPSSGCSDCDLPKFVVCEALDLMEVS